MYNVFSITSYHYCITIDIDQSATQTGTFWPVAEINHPLLGTTKE